MIRGFYVNCEIILLIILLTFFSCDHFEEESIRYDLMKITETDRNGNFSGEIDQTDWVSASYKDVYFGNGFWFIPPKDSDICFVVPYYTEGEFITIKFYNNIESNLTLSASVNKPFLISPPSLTLIPKTFSELKIGLDLKDSTLFDSNEKLTLLFSTGERISFIVCSKSNADSGVKIIHPVIPEPGMYPAYPNPSEDKIIFKFTLAKPTEIVYEIHDGIGNVLKRFFLNVSQAGNYLHEWDLILENGSKIKSGSYRVFYLTDNLDIHGDIIIK